MMKTPVFALLSAVALYLLPMDRVDAMNKTCGYAGASAPDVQSVDSITQDVSTSTQNDCNDPVDPSQLSAQTSFSAHYRLLHQPSETVLDEAQVLYSDIGLRVEQLIDDSGNVFIANHAEEKFWFVDRQRQLVHTIPVIITHNATREAAHPVMDKTAGFIQLSPCQALEGAMDTTGLWQGHAVQHWSCRRDGDLVEEQWFAPTLGVVVRSRTNNGYVSELTDLRMRKTSSLNFQPPSDYRQVSIEELMHPSVPIGSYVE